MTPFSKLLAAVLAVGFATAVVDAGSEAREASGVRQSRHAKASRARYRVAQRRIIAAPVAPPLYAPNAVYAGPGAGIPYGGPGRAYFENPAAGAAPDRAESRSPEGP